MTNYYTEKIKPLIIKALKMGESNLNLIAKTYNVSLQFVRKVAKEYDWFYFERK